jgi:RNA polymerase sigma-70 factor (ECF subfamily)
MFSFVLAALASLFESDAALAERIAAGDQAALRRLYDRLSGRTHALALRILRSRGEAEDVVQDTFVEVWKRADRFEPARGSLATWVTTIAHRRAIDRLRRQRVRPSVGATPEQADDAPAASATPAESMEQRQVRDRLRTALDALPQEQREPIELMYFAGLSQSEAAAHLGHALGTLKSRVRAGMQRLGLLLDELAPEVR